MIAQRTGVETRRAARWAVLLALALRPGVAAAQAPPATTSLDAGRTACAEGPALTAPVAASIAAGPWSPALAPQLRPPQRRPPTTAQAARRQPGRPGSLEVSASADWLGPSSLGSASAQLTSNASSAPFTYFSASGRLGGAPALDARVTYNVVRRVAVEGGFVFSRPSVTFSVSNDAEAPGAVSGSGERLSQYYADANVLVFLPSLTFAAGRGRAFVEGGGGYLRQLHAGNLRVESGTVFNAGAGMKYYFGARPKGVLKGLGLRVDLRAYYRDGGYSFGGGGTWTAALGGGIVAAF